MCELSGLSTIAESIEDLFESIVAGKFTKDGSKLIVVDFICKNNANLTSLVRVPQLVSGTFYCQNNANLISLEGAPRIIGKEFWCQNNASLTSLAGAPQSVGHEFNCWDNDNLTSLEGAPKTVGEGFYCWDNDRLTSLVGGPLSVGGYFYCHDNASLTSLEGAPQSVGKGFYCRDNPRLTSLTNINLYTYSINGGLADFAGCPIKSNILGLLKIQGLRRVIFDDQKLTSIMNKYLPLGSSTDCAAELINEGYAEWAKW